MDSCLTKRALPALPRLGWLARVDTRTSEVHLVHGSSVEAGPAFAVEGVWDGPFAEADFHRAEHFFGSGVRVEGDCVWFVPSHALVDRIVYGWRGAELLVSNSLALLMGYTGARLDPAHDYRQQTFTILQGLRDYEPRFPVVHSQIDVFYQVFHQPIVLRKGVLEKVAARPPRAFSSFEEYVDLLRASLRDLRANSISPHRKIPMRAFSMASSGYDSTAVSALVRDLDVEACFTARRAWYNFLPLLNPRMVIDDGTPVARRLGLSVRYFDPPSRRTSEEELCFYAPCTGGAQVLFLTMAEHIRQTCGAALVFTGFHGDKVWDLHTGGKHLSDELRRGDVSGLDLSEIRLKAGFVNVAVPFMFARSIRDIVGIAQAPEMSPWRLGTDYDRPIPRRIVETAGVPRAAFGRQKRAALQRPPYPFDPTLRRSFLAYIRERYRWPPAFVFLHHRINRIAFRVRGAWNIVRRVFGRRPKPRAAVTLWTRVDFSYEIHIWALQVLSRYYGEILGKDPPFEKDAPHSTPSPGNGRTGHRNHSDIPIGAELSPKYEDPRRSGPI